jgi:hypothetical protein
VRRQLLAGTRIWKLFTPSHPSSFPYFQEEKVLVYSLRDILVCSTSKSCTASNRLTVPSTPILIVYAHSARAAREKNASTAQIFRPRLWAISTVCCGGCAPSVACGVGKCDGWMASFFFHGAFPYYGSVYLISLHSTLQYSRQPRWVDNTCLSENRVVGCSTRDNCYESAPAISFPLDLIVG